MVFGPSTSKSTNNEQEVELHAKKILGTVVVLVVSASGLRRNKKADINSEKKTESGEYRTS